MIKMKAIRQFRGRRDEGKRGLVKPGREFTVTDERRAGDLERGGLAYRVYPEASPAAFMGRDEMLAAENLAPTNPTAVAGPLPSAGGETGETEQDASFSPAAPAPQPIEPELSEPEGDATSSPSTSPTGSRRGRKPYTRATAGGGGRGKGSRRSKG